MFIDYIVVGSDSGRIVILEYNPSKNMFEKIHQETFGKSGCRRIVPGQFLAVDPKGRAVMIGRILINSFTIKGDLLRSVFHCLIQFLVVILMSVTYFSHSIPINFSRLVVI